MASQTTASLFALALFVPLLSASAGRQIAILSRLRARRRWLDHSKNPEWTYCSHASGPNRHSPLKVFMHKLTTYQYAPIPYVNNMGSAELIQFCFYVMLNVTFVALPIPWMSDTLLDDMTLIHEIASRAAWTGTANAFFIVITATRNSALEFITGIPFERMVMFHRWCGRMLFAQFSMHAVLQVQIYDRKLQWYSIFNTTDLSNFFGVLAFLSLAILVASSHSVVRRRYFNAFYFTHFTFVGFMVFGGLHSTTFAKWVAAGLLLYAIDRAIRFSRSRTECETLAVESFPGSNIIKIVLQPIRFHYEAGQYLFLNVPSLDKLAWYPFSISSAPDVIGRNKPITIHMKNNGDWTNKVVNMVTARHVELTVEGKEAEAPNLRMWIDGAYGRSGTPFEDYEVVAMVAGGIGVTPLISFTTALVQRLELGLPTATSDIYFFWFIPSVDVFRALSFELLEIRRRIWRLRRAKSVSLTIRVFLTRDAEKSRKELATLTDAERGMLVCGKEGVLELLRGVKEGHREQDVAVGVCGGKQMVRNVRNACVSSSDRDGLFNVHWETFNF